MTDPLRWGIAGTGNIAAQMADALSGLPEATITAVGSRSPDRAAAFAGERGIAAHGTYHELYANDDVDIVYVASPHSEHCAMTIAALRAGRHVLCEKAFALNAAEAESMVAVAEEHDRFLMEAMWTWFIPAVVELRDRLASGAIGTVRSVTADFSIPAPGATGRLREATLAGGAMLDLGVYPIAFSRFLLGPPNDVRALGHLGPTGVDDNVGAVLGHDGGAMTTFHTGLDSLSTLTATIVGTEGTITVDAPFWCTHGFTVNRQGASEHVDIANDGLAHEAAHAMARIRAGHTESDVIPLSETIAVMRTLDEIRAQIGLTYPMET